MPTVCNSRWSNARPGRLGRISVGPEDRESYRTCGARWPDRWFVKVPRVDVPGWRKIPLRKWIRLQEASHAIRGFGIPWETSLSPLLLVTRCVMQVVCHAPRANRQGRDAWTPMAGDGARAAVHGAISLLPDCSLGATAAVSRRYCSTESLAALGRGFFLGGEIDNHDRIWRVKLLQ